MTANALLDSHREVLFEKKVELINNFAKKRYGHLSFFEDISTSSTFFEFFDGREVSFLDFLLGLASSDVIDSFRLDLDFSTVLSLDVSFLSLLFSGFLPDSLELLELDSPKIFERSAAPNDFSGLKEIVSRFRTSLVGQPIERMMKKLIEVKLDPVLAVIKNITKTAST